MKKKNQNLTKKSGRKYTRKNKTKKTGGKRNRTHKKNGGGKCPCGQMKIFGGNINVPEYAVIPLNQNVNFNPISSTFKGGKRRKKLQQQKKGGGFLNLIDGLDPFGISTPSNSFPATILTGQSSVNPNPYNQPVASQSKFMV